MKCIIPLPEFSFFIIFCFCCISGLKQKNLLFFFSRAIVWLRVYIEASEESDSGFSPDPVPNLAGIFSLNAEF